MTMLQVPLVEVMSEQRIAALGNNESVELELDTMILALRELNPDQPDVVMKTCMSLMARATELWVTLTRSEGTVRKAKAYRLQVQKVMDLMEFMFKTASRGIELRRQEIDLSR